MPVPARRLESGTIWVDIAPSASAERVVVYARCPRMISGPDQRLTLIGRSRLTEWATSNRHEVTEVVTEVGSGLNGKRPKLRRILSDPSATVVVMVVEHRDRFARFGVEHVEAALSARGRRGVVADPGETSDRLVRDVIEVLTRGCARLYGWRGARMWAMRAVTDTKHPHPAAGTV
jgi:putative resolvase